MYDNNNMYSEEDFVCKYVIFVQMSSVCLLLLILASVS